MKISATKIRPGMIILYKGDPCRVMSMLHITPGNWRGMVQVKLRNLRTGSQLEDRLRAEDVVDRAVLDTKDLQYLYQQGEGYVFMDMATYELSELDHEVIGDSLLFIKPDTIIQADLYEGQIIGIELPSKVELKVVQTDPPMKGATAANSPKPATLETGLVVSVPNFIQVGEVVRVDTESGEYECRV